MEKVNGEYQGAAWDFRSGFQCGVLRLAWAKDGSLFAGETNRGWGSLGEANDGLQRLVWNGDIPFEMRAVRAMPDGFEIEFTKPVDKKFAEDIASYSVESFIYKYHPVYGSPPVNGEKCPVKGVKISADGMKARIIVNNLRKHYVHKIALEGIREKEMSYSLVHPTAYYTLNNIPVGQKLPLNETSTKNSAKAVAPAPKKAFPVKTGTGAASRGVKQATAPTAAIAPKFEEIKPLLAKHTCNACHNAEKKQVGPAFRDIAKRRYTVGRIVQLIHTPEPQNWPEYASPMPPMPQVPKEEARKIAAWINALNK
jgi:cytochrome c551/c552